ncbi:DNA-binding protein [Paenibacillus qinlingensis]|uniref:DNA-binding protein n=1 Tax=Paenibacillus qinlingensis TaxID=1837343 RepID=UPI0015673A3A|nr:DNA-binding protein [Paenibacillus qinlingensis]NQX58787.1 DNA-binding protein [Paenibacillus qinlingensis]
MSTNKQEEEQWVLPKGVASPARRALAGAGITKLHDFTRITETDLMKLHGMGPKARDLIREELTAKGLSFKPGS